MRPSTRFSQVPHRPFSQLNFIGAPAARTTVFKDWFGNAWTVRLPIVTGTSFVDNESTNATLRRAVQDYLAGEARKEDIVKKYGEINNWDVSKVTDMGYMFELEGAVSFNQPLNKWNVSNVRDMYRMFAGARSFNQPLNKWNVSKVIDMYSMFEGARSFNQPLNNWNVSNVTNMIHMFDGAESFNQPLNKWNVSNVRVMCGMFWNARSFNQPLNNWDVSNETDMERMFRGASSFNQPLHAPWYVVQPWVEQSESE